MVGWEALLTDESGDVRDETTPGLGASDAVDELLPIVYDELRTLARRHLRRERSWHTLDTTALVNEAYLRVRDQDVRRFENKRHFLAVAAIAMRRILVDYARQRSSLKRGGAFHRIELDETHLTVGEAAEQILAVDQALGWLGELDPRMARIVELRFFAGQTVEETKEALGVSTRTVKREWQKARALLAQKLTSDDSADG